MESDLVDLRIHTRGESHGSKEVYPDPPRPQPPDSESSPSSPGQGDRRCDAGAEDRNRRAFLDGGAGLRDWERTDVGGTPTCLREGNGYDGGAVRVLRSVHTKAGAAAQDGAGRRDGQDVPDERRVAWCPGELQRRAAHRLHGRPPPRPVAEVLPGVPNQPHAGGAQGTRYPERDWSWSSGGEGDVGTCSRWSGAAGWPMGEGQAPDLRPRLLPVSALRVH